MTKLIEEAKAYQPKQIKNIADLDIVPTESEVYEETEAEFPYKYIEVNKERYKVPVSVLSSLKAIVEENPNLKKFKVKKTGEGLKTQYAVIPIM